VALAELERSPRLGNEQLAGRLERLRADIADAIHLAIGQAPRG
jgi:hypothetical protein